MTEETETPAQLAARGPGSKRVLLVDDEPAFLRAMKRALESAGYACVEAPDGHAASEALVREAFDVIVTDIHMAGFSGLEILQLVRSFDLDVPVVLVTGQPSLETALEAIRAGALNYLIKPVQNQDLVQHVERASRLHRMAEFKRKAREIVMGESPGAGDRAGLIASFERSLASLRVVFQPIVDVRTETTYGFEALMRSDEPTLPHPGAILDAAAQLGRLHELGRRMRAITRRDFEAGPSGARLFVNLHTHDLLDDDLFDAASPLTEIASRVVLEVTERAAIDDVKDVQKRVAALRLRGFQIAIDDLGAGYAGLSSFVALEPEIVKLDMSLVRDISTSPIRQKLVSSLLGLSREMGIIVVAEGVETVEECDTVRELGCELMQGYLFARPGLPFPIPTFPPR